MIRRSNSSSWRSHGGSRAGIYLVSRILIVRQHRWAGGDRSGRIGEFVFTTDTPVDQNIVFGRM